jgi:hypothetical protein
MESSVMKRPHSPYRLVTTLHYEPGGPGEILTDVLWISNPPGEANQGKEIP